MPNAENLKPFTAENQPANRGRRKGIPNFATVIKKFVETKIDTTNPLTGQSEKLTVLDVLAFTIIARTEQAKPNQKPRKGK